MIAIHNSKKGFHQYWIAYCRDNNVPYKLVNAYDSDIVEQLSDCSAFMWHHHHADYRDALFAKQLLYSLETAGIKVFPDFHTTWHFDDKVGQKYLFEAIGAPLVPSYVFYTKGEALEWVKAAKFPIVAKLRGGAGSSNVRLLNNFLQAKSYISKAFGKGFPAYSVNGLLRDSYVKWKEGRGTLKNVINNIYRLFFPSDFVKYHSREKGYVYFQDFIPGNLYDIRIVVIGNKAFGIKRLVREKDFRASGSGMICYRREDISDKCVSEAFRISKILKTQCAGYDFVFDDGVPRIVEVSYGFTAEGYTNCEGYWTDDMQWHNEPVLPQQWMIENLLWG